MCEFLEFPSKENPSTNFKKTPFLFLTGFGLVALVAFLIIFSVIIVQMFQEKKSFLEVLNSKPAKQTLYSASDCDPKDSRPCYSKELVDNLVDIEDGNLIFGGGKKNIPRIESMVVLDTKLNSAKIVNDSKLTIQDRRQQVREKAFKKRISLILGSDKIKLLSDEIKGKYTIKIVEKDKMEVRGTTTSSEIKLTNNMGFQGEALKIFMHEFAHAVDLKYPGASEFHKISFSEYNKIKDYKGKGFVSGYAKSNHYEDFAESFTMYVFHNKEFNEISKSNPILRKKYLFLRNEIFRDGEFENTSFTQNSKVNNLEFFKGYIWDMTRVEIDNQKFFDYLNVDVNS